MRLSTLKKRAQFLRVRGGGRHAGAAFVLEGKLRPADDAAPAAARFGFTVTKKLGNAVARNRIRRRLKAAITALASTHAEARFDYVVVAREAAFDRPYLDLAADLVTAFRRVNAGAGQGRAGGQPNRQPSRAGPNKPDTPGSRQS